MKQIADEHMEYLERKHMVKMFEQQPIRILITSHKDVDVPASNYLQPIQAGPGQKSNRFTYMLHDVRAIPLPRKTPCTVR